ncbi:uncharacterized protein LOC135631794 isoform X2 [Musa acuminata AAA Group]|uniref:uncharacterized protein LOC135631794 isoform X2 n=1 Tax=Musa acuminata AAA Group TaxID=214697 RepID=UPI0031DF6E08
MAAPSGIQPQTLAADAHRAGGGGSEEPPHALDVARFRGLNSLIHRANVDVDELLQLVGRDNRVNLMNDSLLSFVIACKKPKLAVRLINKVSDTMLTASNYDGDTALHVAAAMDDQEVASELIRRVPDLVHVRNAKMEIPLHKAALYGLQDTFKLLVENGSSPDARREDGATMLHCAIMGNAPELALQIARYYPGQITNVDQHGVTSLDLMLTIPGLFRSQTLLGFFESILYVMVPSEEGCGKTDEKDAEEEARSSNDIVSDARRDYESLERSRGIRSRFPPHYDTLLDLLELICILARWGLFHLLKLYLILTVYPPMKRLKEQKRRHRAALELIECCAQPINFDLFGLIHQPVGVRPNYYNEENRLGGIVHSACPPHETPVSPESEPVSRKSETTPLIKAAEIGLHEFVGKILQVCPQSATYLDAKGRNVLQVAVKYRRKEIVKIIRNMRTILPSWLFSRIDSETGNTILHLASDGSPDVAKEEQDEPDAMQLFYDLLWFEMVESIIPKELVHSRNTKGKTARELFTSSHKQTRNSCKQQLVGLAKSCIGALAAVVFVMSSSFFRTDDPKTRDSPLFKDLSQAYVIGLSSGALSVLLLLSLVHASYNEQEFRRSIPIKFILASFTYSTAMMYLLLAFLINTFLQIYGEGEKEKQLNKFMLEVIASALLSFFVFPDAIFRAFLPLSLHIYPTTSPT